MTKRTMINLRMQEKLEAGEAFDVSTCARTDEGDYILEPNGDVPLDGDFCDAQTEHWIWSIGKLLVPMEVKIGGKAQLLRAGTYLASTSGKHYSQGLSDTVECVWLR